MRSLDVLLGAFAFVSACDSHPRQAASPGPVDLDPAWHDLYGEVSACQVPSRRETSCLEARTIPDWGRALYGRPPDGEGGRCPVHVRVTQRGVVAEAMTPVDLFEAAPGEECVPDEYAVGTRRTLKVEDGYLVAYAGTFGGSAFWEDDAGVERRFITRAKLAGFVRAPSGTVLALGIGQARLGRGGVIALERAARGIYVPRLVAALPVEPSPVAFDDGGKLLTFAEGFVVRVDEQGKVENLHYFARDLGKVASLAAGPSGDIYLGVDCGVLRLAPEDGHFREDWWSPVTGAGGAWTGCPAMEAASDTNMRVVVRLIH